MPRNPIKILIFTPAWLNREETEFCYARMADIITQVNKKGFFKLERLVLVSNKKDKALAENYGFMTYYTPNDNLGDKKNRGINYSFMLEWDYLMELDSNGVFLPEILDSFKEYFKKQLPIFGPNRILFYNWKDGRMLDYTIQNSGVWVSGRCLRRDVVEKTARCHWVIWRRSYADNNIARIAGEVEALPDVLFDPAWHSIFDKDEVVALWTPGIESAVGDNQEKRVSMVFKNVEDRLRIITNKKPLLLDIKKDDNVSDFDVLARNNIEARPVNPETNTYKKYLKSFGLNGD